MRPPPQLQKHFSWPRTFQSSSNLMRLSIVTFVDSKDTLEHVRETKRDGVEREDDKQVYFLVTQARGGAEMAARSLLRAASCFWSKIFTATPPPALSARTMCLPCSKCRIMVLLLVPTSVFTTNHALLNSPPVTPTYLCGALQPSRTRCISPSRTTRRGLPRERYTRLDNSCSC